MSLSPAAAVKAILEDGGRFGPVVVPVSYADAGEIELALVDLGLPGPVIDSWADAAMEVRNLRNELALELARLSEHLSREAKSVAAGSIVNSLGILQGRALDVDLKEASLGEAEEALARADALVRRMAKVVASA